MNFEKYLHELLLVNETVIIPGFGAFISEYKPAEISKDSNEIKPPSKIVSFNQQIRNNDGLLVGYVSAQRGISHFEALAEIEKERENIFYRLDSGEQVYLKNVGTLYYTKEHKISFLPEEGENLLLDSFGLGATDFTAKKPDPETVEASGVDIEKTATPVYQEEISQAEQVSSVAENKERIQEREPVPLSAVQGNKEESSEEKRKSAWWWYLLILIPLLAVSVPFFMKGMKDGAAEKIAKQQNIIPESMETAIIPPKDSVQTDSIRVVENDSNLVAEETQPTTEESDSQMEKYYLVGGSFSVEENAETYLQELQAKGFDAFHVGKKGRFFCVGIAVYDTFDDAEEARKEYMANNPGSELWVWKK